MFIYSPLPFSLPSFLPFPSMEEGAMEKKKVNHNYGSSLTSLKVINILFFKFMHNISKIYTKLSRIRMEAFC